MWLVLVAAASAATKEDIVLALDRYNEGALFQVPLPSERDLDRLVNGKVVRMREVTDPDKPQRVIGYYVMHANLHGVWVSLRDPHQAALEGLIDLQVGAENGHEIWFQHWDVPRPFADRQWLIDVSNNHDLAKAGGGWEHWWRLTENGPERARQLIAEGKVPGMTVERFDASVYVPDNEGAYFVIALGPDETLFGYHARSTVGGNVPDRLLADYTAFTMNRFVALIENRIPEAVAHYTGDHAPIYAGDGSVLPRSE